MNQYSQSLRGRMERAALRSFYYRSRALVSALEILGYGLYWRRIGLAGAWRIPTYTSRNELRTLFRLAAWMPPGSGVLEIGAYTGASACFLAAGASQVDGHVYCVDTWGNETMPEGERDTFAEFTHNTQPVRRWLTPLRMRSSEIHHGLFRHELRLIFIDGDHSYEQVTEDVRVADALLAADGVLAMHDCVLYPGVSRAVGEALASGRWVLDGYEENLLWMRRANWNRNE